METTKSEDIKEKEELIVISDLHLSDGKNEKTGKYSRNEDFFFDKEFKRFLEHLQKEPPKKHLIIAGDMFDFLQVDPYGDGIKQYQKFVEECEKVSKKHVSSTDESIPGVIEGEQKYDLSEDKDRLNISGRQIKFGLGTGRAKTVWKLRVIAKGHKEFFEALADFISKGNRLTIISGNHDIELYWKEVQDEFRILIFKSKPGTLTKDHVEKNINFFSWFYYNKKLETYIEHGNQYDRLNSFRYFLYPRRKPNSEVLWLPFGSFFVRYFFNKLEAIHPFADNIKPSTKYMRWAWKEDKLQFLKTILHYLPTMIRLLFKGVMLPNTKKELGKINLGELKDLPYKSKHMWEHMDTALNNLYSKREMLPEIKKELEEINDGELKDLPDKLKHILEHMDTVLNNLNSEREIRPDIKKELKELLDKLKLQRKELNTAFDNIYSLREAPFTITKLLNIFVFSTFFFIVITAIFFIVLFIRSYKYVDLSFLSSLWASRHSLWFMIIPFVRGLFRYFKKDFFKKKLVKTLDWIQKYLKDPITKWLLKRLRKDFFEKALHIKKHLETAGINVQTVVFGHTHDPDIRPDMRDVETKDKKLRYFNTGTWTTVFSEEERIIREAKQFAFVRIKDVGGGPESELLRWNDCLKKTERLILFESEPPEPILIVRIIKDIYNYFIWSRASRFAKKRDQAEGGK